MPSSVEVRQCCSSKFAQIASKLYGQQEENKNKWLKKFEHTKTKTLKLDQKSQTQIKVLS